jgi:hypothetical protein
MYVREGRIEVTRRRGRRRKKMLDDLGDRRGYFHLKEKALDRNSFGRDCGPVVFTDYIQMNESQKADPIQIIQLLY